MELSKLPIIDWKLSIKLAGNKKDLAEDMLAMLVKNLADDVASIKYCYENNDFTGLLRRVHRLHGALCYCGLPRLKSVITKLEMDLKANNRDNLPALFHHLDTEATLVLNHHLPIHNEN